MNNQTDIFIRTYKNDLPWLQYCLRSIHKFVTGYRNIIVCIPRNDMPLLNDFNLPNVITCKHYRNDYIGQQIEKLLSYKHTDAEFILFVDSDVCFKAPVHVSEYFRNGKPIIFETPWDKVGDAICWKEPTERILGIETESETMRRLPILYRSDTLQAIDNRFNCASFEKLDRLSEFNLVGSYAKEYEADKYYIWNTETEPDLPEMKHKQFWSWGGLTESIRNHMEEILR